MKFPSFILFFLSVVLAVGLIIFIFNRITPVSSPESSVSSDSQLKPAGDSGPFTGISFPAPPAASPTPTEPPPEFPVSSLQISVTPSPTAGYNFDSLTLPSPTPTPAADSLTRPGR
jgi:hypothetical protein